MVVWYCYNYSIETDNGNAKMLNKIEIAVCLNCDTGVYMRHVSDVRSCNCGNISMEDDGVYVREGVNSYKMERDVPFKKSVEQLAEDFESCADKFGLLRSATKMVAHLRSERNIVIPKRRRFDDDVEGMLSLEA